MMAETSTSAKKILECNKKYDDEDNQVVNNEKSNESNADQNRIPEFSSYVAKHYNEINESGLNSRKESKILHLRNFNNWIKSILIGIYVHRIGRVRNVLDLCCGKGGDLKKWVKSNISHLICADIAGRSVEQCEARYKQINFLNIFSCEFITADCTRVCLREKFQNPNIELDLVSCQFAFHYCFESLPQAEQMLKNITENLKIGGYFIGAIPDANEIVRRLKRSGGKIVKNKIFSLEMRSEEPYPLFGAQYNFELESVVKCPEFLVHFPTLVKLAAKYNLELDCRMSFSDFYNTYCQDLEKKLLLKKMLALESYCLADKSKSTEEYEHAERFCKHNGYTSSLGTISKSEWEAVSLYQVFAFRKIDRCKSDSNSINKA